MNRLILLGNGFDLSHGFKTSYKDFLTYYLWNCLDSFYINGEHEDLLISISYPYKPQQHFTGRLNVDKTFDAVMSEIHKLERKTGRQQVITTYKSDFFRILITDCATFNWVDIELAYFELLKKFKNQEDTVILLNNELSFIKEILAEYLSIVDKTEINFNCESYVGILTSTFDQSDFLEHNLDDGTTPRSIHVVNFNYTRTFENYLTACNKVVPTVLNHIHGQLNNDENPIIFGYGDEFDKDFVEFENLKGNKLFPHIKSFAYFRTRKYHDLIRFINADYFQVFIIGHSCGLSDRTMLKHIFEHSQCKSIKVFHHGGVNDYTEKTFDIARHFTNKVMMRDKIVPFDVKDTVPQIKRNFYGIFDA